MTRIYEISSLLRLRNELYVYRCHRPDLKAPLFIDGYIGV